MMKLTVNGQNLIAVEDCAKDDVTGVHVDQVEFERKTAVFYNTTNNNVNHYDVEIAPTDSIYLELKITAGVPVKDVCVTVMNQQGEQAETQFTPNVRRCK